MYDDHFIILKSFTGQRLLFYKNRTMYLSIYKTKRKRKKAT